MDFLYIDKTALIHDLVNSGSYYFLSRPRRFGKSLLVDTIKELFSGSKECNYTLGYPNLEVKDSLLDNLLSAYRGVFPNTSSEDD